MFSTKIIRSTRFAKFQCPQTFINTFNTNLVHTFIAGLQVISNTFCTLMQEIIIGHLIIIMTKNLIKMYNKFISNVCVITITIDVNRFINIPPKCSIPRLPEFWNSYVDKMRVQFIRQFIFK